MATAELSQKFSSDETFVLFTLPRCRRCPEFGHLAPVYVPLVVGRNDFDAGKIHALQGPLEGVGPEN